VERYGITRRSRLIESRNTDEQAEAADRRELHELTATDVAIVAVYVALPTLLFFVNRS
jgi:hypothetical protein